MLCTRRRRSSTVHAGIRVVVPLPVSVVFDAVPESGEPITMNTRARWRAVTTWIRARLASVPDRPERAVDAHPPDPRVTVSFTTWMR
jgi:hypothetical protein